MRITAIILSILTLLNFYSCETDFEVNASWKEIGIAYMLLDKEDSVQYLKLNRLYLNTDGNANEIAQIEDSLYFNDADMKVILVAGQEETQLSIVRVDNKDDGIFAGPEQWMYRTPDGYKIDQTKPYSLQITNTKSGYEMRSDIRIVKDGTIQSPIQSLSNISFATCDNDKDRNLLNYIDRSMEIVSGKEAKFYDFDAVFHYTEVDTLTKDSVKKELKWIIARSLRSQSANGGAELTTRIKGEAFFDYIARSLEPISGKVRLPISMEFQFHGGGQELYDFINVNKPSIGIVQKKPEYTNIENGLGIFSSRTTQTVTFSFDGCTKIQLAKGDKTGHLGFVRF